MNRGELLREKRKEMGYTQADAARGIGDVSLRSYVSYERGKEPRDKMFWARAAKFFDCDVEEFNVSISEDDAFESYRQSAHRSNARKMAAVATGSTLASLLVGGPPMAAVSLSVLIASYGAGWYVGYKKGMKEVVPESEEALQQMIENRDRFIRAATGIVYSVLIQRGVPLTPVAPPEEEVSSWPDAVVTVDSGVIKSWWLFFEEGKTDRDDANASIYNEVRANALLARFWSFAADPSRKASVVVEDKDLFDTLVAKKGGPYRGNLSAVLVDVEDARVLCEEYLATYEEGADKNLLMPIC